MKKENKWNHVYQHLWGKGNTTKEETFFCGHRVINPIWLISVIIQKYAETIQKEQ